MVQMELQAVKTLIRLLLKILVCTVCPDLSLRKFRVNTVHFQSLTLVSILAKQGISSHSR